MKTFAGMCRGGPWDGRQLDHPQKRFRVVIPIMRPVQIKPLDQPPDKPTFDTEESEYVFVLGQWVWQKRK